MHLMDSIPGVCQVATDLVDRDTGAAIAYAWFPFGKEPAFGAKLNRFELIVLDGKVVGARIMTAGTDVQAEVLRLLEKKYGKPHQLSQKEVQNVAGARFTSIVALWNWPSRLRVSFLGIDRRFDLGTVEIYSSTYLTKARSQSKQKQQF